MLTPTMNARLLLITDEPEAGNLWAYGLRQRGFEVVVANDRLHAVTQAEGPFDLFVIDAFTPELDGIGICRQLRTDLMIANPILLLTYNNDEPSVLAAYQAGADECVAKPISCPLFLAKVTTWLRRAWTVPAEALPAVQCGGWQLDAAARQLVLDDGRFVRLTNLEFRLLNLMMNHNGQILPTNLIVDRVWGFSGDGDAVLLKNLMYRLRRKIESDPGRPSVLQTIAGEGYCFRAPDHMAPPPICDHERPFATGRDQNGYQVYDRARLH